MKRPDPADPYRPPAWEESLTLGQKLEFIRRGQQRIRTLQRLGAQLEGYSASAPDTISMSSFVIAA